MVGSEAGQTLNILLGKARDLRYRSLQSGMTCFSGGSGALGGVAADSNQNASAAMKSIFKGASE